MAIGPGKSEKATEEQAESAARYVRKMRTRDFARRHGYLISVVATFDGEWLCKPLLHKLPYPLNTP